MEFYSVNFKNSLGQYEAESLPLAHLPLCSILCMCWKESRCWPFWGSPPHLPASCPCFPGCVEPGNDMSLSDVLSALTIIILHCYSLEVLIVSQTGKVASDGGGSCRKNGGTER